MGFFLTKAHGGHGVDDAVFLEIGHHGFSSLLRQRQIVILGSFVVGVSVNLNDHLGIFLEGSDARRRFCSGVHDKRAG